MASVKRTTALLPEMSTPAVESPIWVTEETLERRTQIPVRTWQTWRLRGGGPHFYRVNRNIRYNWLEVEAWIRAGRAQSTTEHDIKNTPSSASDTEHNGNGAQDVAARSDAKTRDRRRGAAAGSRQSTRQPRSARRTVVDDESRAARSLQAARRDLAPD